jgi:mono/diheme cytochrome c family protein
MTVRASLTAGLVAALIGLASVACERAAPEPPADPLMDAFRAQAQEEGLSRIETDGKRLFVHYCATCHGDLGEGDGQNAFNLDPPPPVFSESLTMHPSAYWRQIIEGGTIAVGRSPLCPPWGRTLTTEQIDALVAYVQHLATPPAEP